MGVEVSLPEAMGTIKVHALKDLTGDAEVTTMRNKKKYLFDFEFTLEWRGELKDIGPCKGTLKYVKLRQHASNCVTLLLSLEKHVWAPPPLDPLPPTHPPARPPARPPAQPTNQPPTTIRYPDVTPDCDGEYDVLFEVDKHTPPQARGVLDAYVRSGAQGLQPAVTAAIGTFIEAYKAEF